jgi:cytosine/adenosine deaminase-related metal-dependent hydrolase
VNVCLGTDSLATVLKPRHAGASLDMFAEMRAFADSTPGVSPQQILRMSTTAPARALGQAGRVGEISAGAAADLIALPLESMDLDPYAAVLAHHGPVLASMINGRWVIDPATG